MAKPTKQEILNYEYTKDGLIWNHVSAEDTIYDNALDFDKLGENWYTIFEPTVSVENNMKIIFMWM